MENFLDHFRTLLGPLRELGAFENKKVILLFFSCEGNDNAGPFEGLEIKSGLGKGGGFWRRDRCHVVIVVDLVDVPIAISIAIVILIVVHSLCRVAIAMNMHLGRSRELGAITPLQPPMIS